MYEPIKNPSPMMVRVVQVLEMIQDLIVILSVSVYLASWC